VHVHAHLDGSYPLEAVTALARRSGIDFQVPAGFDTVWEFFAAYGTVTDLVTSHEDLAELCRALVRAEAAEGVLYLEPAIEPQLYSPRLGSLEQVTRTILAAFREASADAGIEVGANVTINTDENEELADELATVAATFAADGVTALGTAGFIEPGNLGRFSNAAKRAIAAGLPVVSHAGQTGGPDSIEEALNEVTATRISHGFRAVESDDLVQRLADEQIICDVCPVSNVTLRLVTELAVHPVQTLIARGVPVTLNADDKLWFGAGVTDQYAIARDVWGFSDEQLAAVAANGTRITGMSQETRARFEAELAKWVAA
jgi:adenosine deaminase